MSDAKTKRRLLLVDWVVAGYNLVLGLIWLSQTAKLSFAWVLAAAHLVGLVLPWLLARAPAELSEPMKTLRQMYPLLFLAVFWPELDLLRPILALQNNDVAVAALDLLVFRVPIHDIWMPNMAAVWFSELMHFVYEAYYLLVFAPPLVLLIQRRHEALSDATFRLVLIYLICFVIYAGFPVDGPHFLHEPFQGPHTSGFFYGVNQTLQASGDSLGCSFPSSHVAAAVSAAYVGWLYFPRWVAIIMAIEALGVTLATVYIQSHYAIDSLAGLLLALLVQLWVVPKLYARFGSPTEPLAQPAREGA